MLNDIKSIWTVNMVIKTLKLFIKVIPCDIKPSNNYLMKHNEKSFLLLQI